MLGKQWMWLCQIQEIERWFAATCEERDGFRRKHETPRGHEVASHLKKMWMASFEVEGQDDAEVVMAYCIWKRCKPANSNLEKMTNCGRLEKVKWAKSTLHREKSLQG